jgi:hypothetical protein
MSISHFSLSSLQNRPFYQTTKKNASETILEPAINMFDCLNQSEQSQSFR